MASLLRSFQQQREDDEGSSGGSDGPPHLAQSGRDGRGGRGSIDRAQQQQQQRQQQCFDVEDVVRRFPMLQELLIVLPDCEFSLDREASLHWYADFNETLSSCAIVAADSISLLSHPTPIPLSTPSPTSSAPTASASPPPSTPPAPRSPPPSAPPAPPTPPSPVPPPPPPVSCPHQGTSLSNRRPSRIPSLSRSSSQPPLWAPLWDWMSAAGTSSPRQATATAASTTHQQATTTATDTSPSSSSPGPTSPSHPSELCNGSSPSSPCHENTQGDAGSAGKWMGNKQQRSGDRGKARDKGKGKEKVELRRNFVVETGDGGNAGQVEQQGGCIVARLGFSRVVDITDSSQQPYRNERPAVGMPPPVPARSLSSMTRLLAASRGPPTSPTSSCFPTSSTRRQPFRPPPIRLTPNGLKERIAWTISAAVAASARHELLRRIARQLPELRQVAIADVQGQGSLSLGPEQV
ncbi:unnamed protein product [Closterium sp. Naga37s-1]|nr:unnamed protein product [Closterium sp. Naga37s-1]